MSLFDSMLSGFGGGGNSRTSRRPNLLDETLSSRPKKPDPKLFSLTDSVGVYGSNRPKDVKKMESGLNKLGFMDNKKTGDSKGQFSAQLRQGMQAFQKASKLAVDGQANVGGPTATTLSQQVKKIRERRAAEEKQALTPKPPAPKPTPAPALSAKPRPWWRTRKPIKMPDEDYSSTRRTMEGMLRYGDDGDLPNLYADSIRNDGNLAANEMAEFLRQLEETAPKRVKGFEKAVFNKLNDDEKEKYFPEVFGKKPEKKSLLQQAAYRPEDNKGKSRNASYPILGDGDGNDLRIKTAQNASSGAQPPKTLTPPPRKPASTPQSVSPISNPIIRNDSMGSGHFGASRDNGKRKHKGIDIIALPDHPVMSPVEGKIERIGDPYGDGKYKIIWIKTKNSDEVGLFYVRPSDPSGKPIVNPGDTVKPGQVIGSMQDLKKRFPNMDNHVHFEVKKGGKAIDPTPWLKKWKGTKRP